MIALRFLLLSLGLNGALIVAAVMLWRPPAKPASASVPQFTPQQAERQVMTNVPAITLVITNRFHWRQVVSTNYDEFVTNLRAVGCPERTIRDIIVGDAWQVYEACETVSDAARPFWISGLRREAANRQRQAALLDLKVGLTATLRRLFGITWTPEFERDIFDTEHVICRVLLGEVSEEQYERAAGLLLSVEDAKDDIQWRCRHVLLEEDYAELADCRNTIERELRTILSPAQFEEFSARVGTLEMIFDNDALQELKPTPTEARQVALARATVRPLGWRIMDLDDTETEEQKEDARQELGTRLLAILGEERFGEFQRLQDGVYRQIRTFASQRQLPSETARRLYDIHKLTQAEAQRLREDKTFNAGDRTRQLESVTETVAREVGALLGPQVFAEYLSHGGQWITNLNHL